MSKETIGTTMLPVWMPFSKEKKWQLLVIYLLIFTHMHLYFTLIITLWVVLQLQGRYPIECYSNDIADLWMDRLTYQVACIPKTTMLPFSSYWKKTLSKQIYPICILLLILIFIFEPTIVSSKS